MISIDIIAVGKIKEKYFTQALDEYKKRLSRFAKLTITEIPDEKIPDNASQKQKLQILEKEGEKIISKLKDGFTVAMCIEGAEKSSEELAALIDRSALSNSRISFIIGGSLGLSDEVKQRSDLKLSFGKITLPHQLMRIVLSEQIYRSFKIINGEAYHK